MSSSLYNNKGSTTKSNYPNSIMLPDGIIIAAIAVFVLLIGVILFIIIGRRNSTRVCCLKCRQRLCPRLAGGAAAGGEAAGRAGSDGSHENEAGPDSASSTCDTAAHARAHAEQLGMFALAPVYEYPPYFSMDARNLRNYHSVIKDKKTLPPDYETVMQVQLAVEREGAERVRRANDQEYQDEPQEPQERQQQPQSTSIPNELQQQRQQRQQQEQEQEEQVEQKQQRQSECVRQNKSYEEDRTLSICGASSSADIAAGLLPLTAPSSPNAVTSNTGRDIAARSGPDRISSSTPNSPASSPHTQSSHPLRNAGRPRHHSNAAAATTATPARENLGYAPDSVESVHVPSKPALCDNNTATATAEYDR